MNDLDFLDYVASLAAVNRETHVRVVNAVKAIRDQLNALEQIKVEQAAKAAKPKKSVDKSHGAV
jgi:hypothetical protein